MASARRTLALLRFTAFDTSTELGRANERHRHIAWTSLTAALSKAASLLVMLISVPLTLSYLGPERFGLWMTVSAVIAMFGFADFGLSNGMLNTIAHASGRDAIHEIRGIVSSGFVMLGVASIAVLALFLPIYGYVPWSSVFNVTTAPAIDEAGPVLMVLILCFAATLSFGATQKIQMGLQQGYWSNLWEMLGTILSLVAIVCAINLDGGLVWIALAAAGTPVVFRLINTLVFFIVQKTELRPRLSSVSVRTTRQLIHVGLLFFILQVSIVVGFQSDNIVIARILGAESVAGYDVVMKLAMLPAMFVGLILVGQWPAYGEASTRGDIEWIKTTFYRTLRLTIVGTIPFALVLLLWGAAIVKTWAGPEVVPSALLLIGAASWSVILSIGSVIAALLNGLNVVRFQAVSAILMASGNILLSIFLVYKIGVAGAIFGTVVAYSIFTLFPCLYFVPRHIRRLRARVGH